MFSFLKKKLKEGVEKLSSALSSKPDAEEKPAEPIPVPLEHSVLQEPFPEPEKEEVSVSPEHLKTVDEKKEEAVPVPLQEERKPAEAVEELKEKEEGPVPTIPEETPLPEKPEEELPKPVKPIEEKTEPEILKKEIKLEKKILREEKKIETELQSGKEKKTGFLEKLKKAVKEKEIEEQDITPILIELETDLLESDVALEVTEKIVSSLKKDLLGKSIKRSEDLEALIKKSLKKSILEVLSVPSISIEQLAKQKKPLKIVFLGFNGAGKTTSIARLAHYLKNKGFSTILAAADTWRAASIEQLEEHAARLEVPIVKHKYQSDPAAVIFDTIKAAESRGIDIVLADTAGRSQANTNLMDELKKIIRVNKPDLKILVIDALTGNDSVEQAKLFNEAVGVDGIIVTKADVYEKGGALLSAVHSIKKPILFIGVGQEYGDFKPFVAEEVVESLLS
ncbi:MAG: signal recognition particle-docking protein FtsY [Candidatus Aenigmarchaeota archaeon]|nr:signal recognition particle-docking protein FtsY [Candidatus Aenigmarchaeota archaeon]